MRVTHLGTATLLFELGGLTFLTDPALDPPGRKYRFAFGTSSIKTAGPALTRAQLPPIDAVLLSHDEHADNLDGEGRALLPAAGKVLTTRGGARRLSLPNALGLAPFEKTRLGEVTIHAVPAQHGQRPLIEALVGACIGFVLEYSGRFIYISGDTVYFAGLERIARAFPRIDTAFLHLGGVRFSISGPLRYTFDGKSAARAARLLNPRTIVPVHYEGWTHFHEPLAASLQSFGDLAPRVRVLTPGVATDLA